MQTNRKRILIADDEPVIRTIIGMALGNAYETVEAGDGEEAWEKFATADPPFDLVIADLRMPRLGGADLVKQIRQRNARVPAILLTGNLEANVGSQTNVRVITKPFDNQALAAEVKSLLASSS